MDEHDQDMEGDGGGDLEKPMWDDDIDIEDLASATKPSKKKKKKDKKKGDVGTHADGVDVDAMDAEVEPIFDEEEWDGTEEMRKRVLDKYMDEVYGLEFNDMVRRFLPPPSIQRPKRRAGRRPSDTVQVHARPAGPVRARTSRDPYGDGCGAEPVRRSAPIRAVP